MGLTDSLISYWKLDESSGSALDAHGTNHLTDNNTVTAAAGKINGARDFELNNSEYFNLASNSSLQTGHIDFTVAYWVNFESIGAVRRCISKFGNFGNLNEYISGIGGVTTDKFDFALCQSNGNIDTVVATSFGTVSIATWYFVVCRFDSVNNIMRICVNDGTVDTNSSAGPSSTNVDFALGCIFTSAGTVPIQFMDGLIDEVGFWKRHLSAAEITELYNSGNGITYPFSDVFVAPHIASRLPQFTRHPRRAVAY